ncbi:MAG: hypothetical protein JSW51_09285 [Gemmatimonadota bacterium]|nr:MAG: hypothetical protein JSW51_09285 [Gemmatimonadota bacterium]
MKKILRWKAIVPLALLLVLFGVCWWLLSDKMVERSIEDMGAQLIGAKVDLAEVDLSLREGRVRLVGLQAANPNSPMRNLLEASEIVADVRVAPLFRKKVLIEQASIRGVRFGTERTESGELENPSPESGRLMREISSWTDRVRIPPLNLEGLNTVVDVGAVSIDSLTTVTRARGLVTSVDSTRRLWESELQDLDPRPLVDTARVLIERLNSANPLTLGLTGVTELANSSREVMTSLGSITDRVSALDSTVQAGMALLGENVSSLADTRNADYNYARRLLRLPSLDAPNLSASLFGDMAVGRLEPILYWANQVERFLPPGLNPRRLSGPRRPRRSGVTVTFPDESGDPGFLLETGDADLRIGGTGAGAGDYAAQIAGLTTQPAIYGRPMTAMVQRTDAAVGPTDIRVSLVLDHTGAEVHDSGAAYLNGIDLPQFNIGGSGITLDMGQGLSELSVKRTGDGIEGRWMWRSDEVSWSRGGGSGEPGAEGQATAEAIGAFAQDFLWDAVSSLRDVEISVSFSGSVRGPSLRIGSNVGQVVAASLRRELGERIQQAEQMVRARVDELVDRSVGEVESRLAALDTEVAQVVGVRLTELTDVRAELEQAIRRIIPRP